MRRLAVLIAFLILAVPASADAKRLVRYDVTGGLAGQSTRLFIERDGSARETDSRDGTEHFTVPAKQFRALKRELKAARFKSLKGAYQPEFPVMDGQTQTVTYKGRSVSIYTSAKIPKRLSRVTRRLARLMR